jgi:hypothetical protein
MNQARTQSGFLSVGTVLLILFTAGCHLYLGLNGLRRPLNIFTVLFLLNGLGYLTLLAALTFPIPQLSSYRHLVRRVLMGYAALTVVTWVALVATIHFGAIPLAYVAKVDELALIAMLWLAGRQTSLRVEARVSQ